MPSARPKGSGAKAPPMSERQQMALLMQMTSSSLGGGEGGRSPGGGSSRSRDRNERGETPLHLAAIKGDVEQVCKLLAHRADPNVADFAGWTPLHEACNHGWYEVAFRLVQAGANVNAKGLDNDTPLHDAAANGHFKLVKLLVEKGADIHAKNSKGKTPLDTAAPGVAPIMLNPSLPIPETSTSTRLQPRLRDDKKVSESSSSTKQKSSATTDAASADSSASASASKSSVADDVYEFKSVKESSDSSPDTKSTTDTADAEGETAETAGSSVSTGTGSVCGQLEDGTKRTFSEASEGQEEGNNDEESRRKKRKEEGGKETKGAVTQRREGQGKGQSGKQGSGAQGKAGAGSGKSSSADRKSPCPSPKPTSASDCDEEGKTDLKVPPLKIVIPQTTSGEQESGPSRNGKSSSQRSHPALPYVVPSSNSNDSNEKEATSGTASPTDTSGKGEEKRESSSGVGDEQRSGSSHQRVLRSSHRTDRTGSSSQGPFDRSNNSSPQLQRSHSPSPLASPSAPSGQTDAPPTSSQSGPASSATTAKVSDSQANNGSDTECSTTTTAASNTVSTPASVDLHPRKRKLKPNKEVAAAASQNQETQETATVSEVHPHEQPITNCYQLYLNIRKQIEKRRKGLFPVQPKPPQGFKDYLMNRCTYVLAGTTSTTPNISYPPSLPPQMKDLFTEQEKERYRLRMQHVIEKEKLVLSVEQEILRVHGRAARALANQSLPFSVCTILRDEEVYNLITPEQEEKDRYARSRYNGRMFLSWLQDVDDKWEKIKEHMLLRHHNEAESLHAVQKMDWEWKLKELSLCDAKSTPTIDEVHVPQVHVSDDFDLLPA